jgi:hypothetical protein
MERSRKVMRFLKKRHWKQTLDVRVMPFLKKCINGNQKTMWWCKLLYEVTHFYKEK